MKHNKRTVAESFELDQADIKEAIINWLQSKYDVNVDEVSTLRFFALNPLILNSDDKSLSAVIYLKDKDVQ